jgi:hypothetical protein
MATHNPSKQNERVHAEWGAEKNRGPAGKFA